MWKTLHLNGLSNKPCVRLNKDRLVVWVWCCCCVRGNWKCVGCWSSQDEQMEKRNLRVSALAEGLAAIALILAIVTVISPYWGRFSNEGSPNSGGKFFIFFRFRSNNFWLFCRFTTCQILRVICTLSSPPCFSYNFKSHPGIICCRI